MDTDEIYAWIRHKLSYEEFQSRIKYWMQRFGGLCDTKAAALLAAHEVSRIPCPIAQVIPGYWFMIAGKLSHLSESSRGFFGILMDNSGGIGVWIQDPCFKLGESLQVLGRVFKSGMEFRMRGSQIWSSILSIEPGYHRISQLKPGFYYDLVAQVSGMRKLRRGWELDLRDPTGSIRARIPNHELPFKKGDWIRIQNGLMLEHRLWIGETSRISVFQGLRSA